MKDTLRARTPFCLLWVTFVISRYNKKGTGYKGGGEMTQSHTSMSKCITKHLWDIQTGRCKRDKLKKEKKQIKSF